MHRLKRQFGARVALLFAACPSLLADLKQIRRRGVRICRLNGHCQAYSEDGKKVIWVHRRCRPLTQIFYLAHEFEHALRGKILGKLKARLTRQEYVEIALAEETNCVLHEIAVAYELLEAGLKINAEAKLWCRRFERGGRQAIRNAIERTLVSTTNERYPRYYSRQFDELA